jgi:signal peptidase I
MSADKPGQRPRRPFADTVTVIAEALVIALVIRTFLFQTFNIPSGSMEPTLLIGDYLFVSKYSYGYSRYSLPLPLPLFSGRILGSRPERGDIVVFRHGEDDFIKRVIGLPGERIQLMNRVVLINGTPVKRQRVDDFMGRDPCSPAPRTAGPIRVTQFREELPNGVSYNTLQCSVYEGFPDTTEVYTVPPDRFFMMGDNRENSEDSRFPDVGYVPFENLIGRSQILFFSIAGGYSALEIWRWPEAMRWRRIGTLVR